MSRFVEIGDRIIRIDAITTLKMRDAETLIVSFGFGKLAVKGAGAQEVFNSLRTLVGPEVIPLPDGTTFEPYEPPPKST